MGTDGPKVVSCSKGGQYKTKNTSPQKSPTPVSTPKEFEELEAAAAMEIRDHTRDHAGNIHAPLSRDYLDKVRPFIDLIDTLRDHGLDHDVDLPAVAVIGDQSAGKSSTLEAISGIQLPRGSGIVTRCPLVLRLKSTVQGDRKWRAKIQYTDKRDEKVKKEILEPEKIGECVREAQNRITDDDKDISEELITLDVESEDVPDLTLIDLPGIVRVATGNQADDIGDRIKNLIKTRIKKQETIILAVVPANQDIATTEAICLAEEVDPKGERTLGVVTKPDLIDKGTENELIRIVNNRSVQLEKGYTVVKCRGQQMIQQNVPLEVAIRAEETFFREQPHFQDVDKSLLGIRNLSKKLTTELVNQIKGTIPRLKKEVTTKITDTQEKLSHIGRELPRDPAELNFFCIQVLNGFVENFREKAQSTMFSKAREIYSGFLTGIAKATPDYGSAYYIRTIELEAEQHRGRELPRFMNYRVCEKLIIGILKKFQGPALKCLDQVAQLVDETMTASADDEFEQFPDLKRVVQARVGEIRDSATEVCKARIDELLEMEKIVFTQDKSYCHDLDIVKENYRQKAQEPEIQLPLHENQGFSFNQVPTGNQKWTVAAPNKHTTDYLAKKHLERLAKGHRLSSASLVNEVDAEHKRTTAEEIFHMIQAYMEVSVRRLSDYIPLTITLHLIKRLQQEVQYKVLAVVADPDLSNIIYEDKRVIHKREDLKDTLKRLETAKKELVRF